MIAFAYYLLKVVICSGLLFFYYHIALRNKLFHQWNRFYLLAAIVLSLVVPCVQFNIETARNEKELAPIRLLDVVYTADEYVADINTKQPDISSNGQWSTIAYCMVSIAVLIFFILALLRIRSIVRSHSVMPIDDIKFVNTEEKNAPFSFLNYVFWNKQIELDSPSGEHIFKHELVHVREKHSLDKLFIQLVLVVYWANPFFWFIRRELKMIHEFIADKKSVGQSDAHAFAAMILQSSYPSHFNHLTNQFFQSSIKRRLTMLTKKHNPKINYISRVLALLLFAFVLFAFSSKTRKDFSTTSLTKEITVVLDAGHGGGDGAISEGYTEDELVLQLAKTIKAQNSDDNVKILLTRENEEKMDLKERVEFARVNNADLFISLHMNAVPTHFSNLTNSSSRRRANGYEIGVSNKNTVYQKQSELLASALIKEIGRSKKTFQGLVKRQTSIWVLDQNICPSVMIDCGYITDKEDREFIMKKENQEVIAQKILTAIELYVNNTTGKEAPSERVMQNNPEMSEIVVVDLLSKGNESGKVNIDTTLPKSIFFDSKKQIAIEFDEISHSTVPEKSTVNLSTAMLIVNGERVPNDIFKRKTIVTNKLKFIEGKDAVKIYGQAAALGAIVFEGARYIDTPVAEYYKDIFQPKNRLASDPSNKIFEKVEVEAEFPGGSQAWTGFLERNLNTQIPVTKRAPIGTYTVIVQYVVGTDGSISDVKAKTNHGYGMEEEAVRVIKRGPRWTPAIQNGRPVNAYRRQPITFYVAAK
jgi:N-acetylmuramoyl-L-alanine amidase